MPTIRQRVARAILGPERDQLKSAIAALAEARQYVMLENPGNQASQDKFQEDMYIDTLLQLQGWQNMGGGGSIVSLDKLFTETLRLSLVAKSRWMYHMGDPLVARAVNMYTDFGFGQSVEISATDPVLDEVLQEFWAARRNAPVLGDVNIYKSSIDQTIDGETFFAIWFSTIDGTCTVRRLATEEISQIVSNPDDRSIPLWYVSPTTSGNVYYADWRTTPKQLAAVELPAGAILADKLRQDTHVWILPAQYNTIGTRGWPMLKGALSWAKAYSDFIGDRATVAKKAALRVEKLTAKNAGQRTIDSIVSRLESQLNQTGYNADNNQNRTAGQIWAQNEQVNLEWMNRDTGASGAQIDGLTIAAQFAAGAGIPLHWLGRADAMQNRAVAKESAIPWYELSQRLQTFWVSIYSDMAEIVGRAKNEYGSPKTNITDYSVKVTLDAVKDNDVAELATAMSSITGAATAGQLDSAQAKRANEQLTGLLLTACGVRHADDVLTPEETPTAADAGGSGMEEKKVSESANEVLREYEDWLTRSGFNVLNGRWSKIDYRRAHKAALTDFSKRAYSEGMRDGGADPDESTDRDAERIVDWVSEQRQYVDGYADFLASVNEDGKLSWEAKRMEMANRIDAWVASLRNLAQMAETGGGGADPALIYDGTDGEMEPCDECAEWKGQTHKLSWWERRGLTKRNGNSNFGCGRWENCKHHFYDVRSGKIVID
jgi:hypothetical protein